ncbi:MAG: response regulator [Phycisphaerae bacterium]|nr:response regulator [Phycisphaerae bacterium]
MRVLLAEDDTASRMILEKHLSDWGYEVLTAENGSEAWEIIRTQQPQIVLIDWIMPGMDGLELCKKIRSVPDGKYIYLIFLTSKAQNEDIVIALDAGADDYLCKPFDREVLKSRMAVGVRTVNYEDQLVKSEERYHRITDGITDYIFTVTISDGRITEFIHSDTSISVTGYDKKELTDNSLLWLQMVHKDDQLQVRGQLDKCTAGEKVEPLEYRIIRKDGAVRWVKSTIVQHFDRDGRLDSFDGLLQDITERKNAETEMKIEKEKAEESQAKLERLNLQLEVTYKKLMETAHSAGMAEVAADVLHNVGNVLNSINVSAATLVEKLSKSDIGDLSKLAQLLCAHSGDLTDFLENDPQGKYIPTYLSELSSHLTQQQNETVEKLGAIIKNVKQIKDIVKMQRSYTGIERHQDCVLLQELIENAIEINNAGLQRQNIEVIREYDDIGYILIDRQRCLQAIVNLIDNAARSLSMSNKDLKILKIRTVRADGLKLRIEICDNGIGVAAGELNSIFDRGYTTKQTGGGFGLHSSLLAVKDMQGTITAQSSGRDKGAMFIIELPLRKAEVTNGKQN